MRDVVPTARVCVAARNQERQVPGHADPGDRVLSQAPDKNTDRPEVQRLEQLLTSMKLDILRTFLRQRALRQVVHGDACLAHPTPPRHDLRAVNRDRDRALRPAVVATTAIVVARRGHGDRLATRRRRGAASGRVASSSGGRAAARSGRPRSSPRPFPPSGRQSHKYCCPVPSPSGRRPRRALSEGCGGGTSPAAVAAGASRSVRRVERPPGTRRGVVHRSCAARAADAAAPREPIPPDRKDTRPP